MKFSKIIFFTAGIYGLLALLPQYFLEEKNGRDFPPAITHPEYYYGFIGLAIAFQIVFLIIARDPARYRPLMLVSVIEKYIFAVPAFIFYLQGRLSTSMLGAAIIDAILGLLFVVSFFKTRDKEIY